MFHIQPARQTAWHAPAQVVVAEGQLCQHSAALGLNLCWEDGQLRWYDPASGRYLLTYDAALERVRDLEDQVRRLQGR